MGQLHLLNVNSLRDFHENESSSDTRAPNFTSSFEAFQMSVQLLLKEIWDVPSTKWQKLNPEHDVLFCDFHNNIQALNKHKQT